LVRVEAGEGELIAGELALLLNARHGQPDERVEPMHRANGIHQPVDGNVVPAQMRELVKDNVAQLLAIERAAHPFRENERRTKKTVKRGTVDERGFDHHDRATYVQLRAG